jgi:hypothetical protein
MRSTVLCLSLVVAAVGLVAWSNAPVALAAEEEKEHQGARQEAGVAAQPASGEMMCCKHGPAMCKSWSCHGAKREHCCAWGLVGAVLLVWLICNILLAGWIFTDIRKQGQGHGVFVALALLAGFPAAILYALIRIGDKKS